MPGLDLLSCAPIRVVKSGGAAAARCISPCGQRGLNAQTLTNAPEEVLPRDAPYAAHGGKRGVMAAFMVANGTLAVGFIASFVDCCAHVLSFFLADVLRSLR